MPPSELTLPQPSRRPSVLERASQAFASRIGFAPTLALLGLLSELIYLWFFVRCFPLLRYYNIPLLDMGKITNHELGWGLAFMGAVTALFALYWLGLRLVQAHEARASRRILWVILICAVVFSISLLFVYPWGAADLYDYAIFGRVLVHYQANPFVARGIDFPSDPLNDYAPWSNTTVAYGPLWLLFAGIASLIAQADLLTNLLAYKIMVLLFYWLMIWLIALLLRAQNHKQIAAGVLFWAWNPLVLLETMANGHNDVMMIAFVLLALYLLMRRRAVWSMISLAGAALVKFTSVLIAPLFLVADLKEQQGWRGKLRYLIQGGAAFLLTIVLVMAPFWSGSDPLALKRRIKMFTTSLPTLFANLLVGRIGEERAAFVAQFIAAAILGLFCLYLIRQMRRGRISLTAASFEMQFVYLAFACSWFQPWYLVWLIGLGALCLRQSQARVGLFFSFAALGNYFVFHHLWFTNTFATMEVNAFRTLAMFLIIGPAVALWLVERWREARKR